MSCDGPASQRGVAIGWIAGSAMLVAVGAAPSARAQPEMNVPLTAELLVTGLSAPTTMAFVAPGDLLVLQKQDGRVLRVEDGSLHPQPVLDVAVNADAERGLLGIAVNSESPPVVFLYFTEAAVDGGSPIANRVYRYDWNPAAGVLENPSPVLDLPVLPGAMHNGGVLVLGPPGEVPGVGDGALLYVVIGDVNRAGQLQNQENGAPPDDTSVVLRVKQDGSRAPGNPFLPYCSDTSNAFCLDDDDCPGVETCTTQVARYFAYGIRNSFGLALDPVTGELWDTENGPSTNDEVNLVEPGFNSGWVDVMGPVSSPSGLFQMPRAGDTYSEPEFTWSDTIAPTALLFPVGSTLGLDFDESLLVADHNAGQLYRFPLNAARDGFDLEPPLDDRVAQNDAERDLLAIGGGFGAITDLAMGPDGTVHVVSISQGAIYTLPEPDRIAGLVLGVLGMLGLGRRRTSRRARGH